MLGTQSMINCITNMLKDYAKYLPQGVQENVAVYEKIMRLELPPTRVVVVSYVFEVGIGEENLGDLYNKLQQIRTGGQITLELEK